MVVVGLFALICGGLLDFRCLCTGCGLCGDGCPCLTCCGLRLYLIV